MTTPKKKSVKKKTAKRREVKIQVKTGEGSHWYNDKGQGVHEIESKGKPGEFRPTDKRDAAELGLKPSVTNLLNRIFPKPGLDDWKRNMLFTVLWDMQDKFDKMMSARISEDKEEFTEIAKAMTEEAAVYAKQAAEIGTNFHAAMELMFEHTMQGGDDVISMRNADVRRLLAGAGISEDTYNVRAYLAVARYMVQKSFFPLDPQVHYLMESNLVWNHPLSSGQSFGIGGKTDMIITISKGEAGSLSMLLQHIADPEQETRLKKIYKDTGYVRVLLDWKTRKPRRLKNGRASMPAYNTDAAQLAAYRIGAQATLDIRVDAIVNVIVPSDVLMVPNSDEKPAPFSPLDLAIRVYTPEQERAGMAMMDAACSSWVANERVSASAAAAKGKPSKEYIPLLLEEDDEIQL